MERRLECELLDDLPAEDPGAVGSRRDLVRLNRWMGHAGILAKMLRTTFPTGAPQRIVELGAGDGTLMLELLSLLPTRPNDGAVVLVDQRAVVRKETAQAIESRGWRVELQTLEVFDCLRSPSQAAANAMIANLFLHHFTESRLAEMFQLAARKTNMFVAVEPRRSVRSLWMSRLLGFAGCNHVTRHDAPASVIAGFRGRELSALWPSSGWSLEENTAGKFSHVFVARRGASGSK